MACVFLEKKVDEKYCKRNLRYRFRTKYMFHDTGWNVPLLKHEIQRDSVRVLRSENCGLPKKEEHQ